MVDVYLSKFDLFLFFILLKIKYVIIKCRYIEVLGFNKVWYLVSCFVVFVCKYFNRVEFYYRMES